MLIRILEKDKSIVCEVNSDLHLAGDEQENMLQTSKGAWKVAVKEGYLESESSSSDFYYVIIKQV